MSVPTIEVVHEEFCKAQSKEYVPENIVKDLAWNCFAVALVLEDLLKKQGVNARAVYGMWEGYCVSKKAQGHFRHGWVVIDGKTIIDPTRWVFDDKLPRMYRGSVKKSSEYDEGMAKFRQGFRKPFPKFDKSAKLKKFNWSKEASVFFFSLTGQNCSTMTIHQALWCCNVSYHTYGSLLNEIYTEFDKQGCIVFIPMDYISYWKSIE